MDPSRTLAILSLAPNRNPKINSYSSKDKKLDDKLEYVPRPNNLKINPQLASLVSIKTNKALGKKLEGFTPKQIAYLKKISNPFSNLGKSIFINDGAVKIANIDGVLNFTNSKKGDLGILPSTLQKRYKYMVLGDSSGSIAQYIQYRKKFTLGYGMSILVPQREEEMKSLHEVIETKGVNIYYREWGDKEFGGDGTGNLYINTPALAQKMKTYHDGVNLVIGVADMSNTKNKEEDTFRLLLNQIYGAVAALKEGGNAVIKCFDITKNITAQLIYIYSLCFEEFYIIKPVSSSPISTERYLVGLRLRNDTLAKSEFLDKVSADYSKYSSGPTNLIDGLPDSFVKYIKQTNTYIYARANEVLRVMYKQSINYQKIKTEYNISRLYMAWDIPSH